MKWKEDLHTLIEQDLLTELFSCSIISLFEIEVENIHFSQLKTKVLNDSAIFLFKSRGGIRKDITV